MAVEQEKYTSTSGTKGDPRDGDGGFSGNNRFGGWVPDLPDPRDFALIPRLSGALDVDLNAAGPMVHDLTDDQVTAQCNRLVPEEVPDGTDEWSVEGWRGKVPVVDQQPLESCVSCAISSVINYLELRENGHPGIDPSRLFLYYNTRVLEGTQDSANAGTGIRTAIKALSREGVCDESDWPYDPEKVTSRPDDAAIRAATYRDIEYHRVYRLRDANGDLDLGPIRRALYNNIPVICGFTAFRSFGQARTTGHVPMPTADDARDKFNVPDAPGRGSARPGFATFGHAAVIIGFEGDRFRLVNSWGAGWGPLGGEFTMPAAYLANRVLATDFWTITSLSAQQSSTAA